MSKSPIHSDASNFLFSDELRETLLNAKFWDERQLLALCLGVVPKKYGDRDDCAPECERRNSRDRIDAGIARGLGTLYATKNPNAGPAESLYGGVWDIEPIHAAKWVTSEFPNFPKFPEWLLSELQSRYETQVANRQSEGYYTLDEAVESIAEQESMNDAERKKLLKIFLQAACTGLMTVHDMGTGISPINLDAVCHFREIVRQNEVNEWAKANKALWSWGLTHSPRCVVTKGSSGGAEPDKAGPGWSLKTSIKRAPGYRWTLYQTLKDAHIAGQPCPKPRDVLKIWGLNPPLDVQVMPDGVKYNDGLGNSKEANLKAIGQAIKNLMK